MGVTKTRGASLIGFLHPWFSDWLIGAVMPSVTFHSVIPRCAEKGGKCSGTAAKAALSAPPCQSVWSELRFVQWLWCLHPPVGNPSSCGSLLWSPAQLLKDLSTSFFPEFTLPKPCTSSRGEALPGQQHGKRHRKAESAVHSGKHESIPV